MSGTPRLSLDYLEPNQANKHVTLNEGLKRLDSIVQLSVGSRSASAQPAEPAEGGAYILPPGATGESWSGQTPDTIAVFQDMAWSFIAPRPGWRAWVEDEALLLVHDGAGWERVAASPETVARLGVNASADNTNLLVVKSDATLFSHDDQTPGNGSHRLSINKAAASDQASVIFQTGYTGHAEFGLNGDLDFSLRVSADGANFQDALSVSSNDGQVFLGHPDPSESAGVRVRGALQVESRGAVQHRFVSQDWYQIIVLENHSSAQPWHTTYIKARRARGEQSAPEPVNNGDLLFAFDIEGHDGSGFHTGAKLRAFVDGTPGGAHVPVGLAIELARPSGGFEDVLHVTGTGRVGLGSVSPTVKLQVRGPLRTTPVTRAELPAPQTCGAGCLAFVSDLVGGGGLAVSTGTEWREIPLGSLVS